jgi:hypothetical protein
MELSRTTTLTLLACNSDDYVGIALVEGQAFRLGALVGAAQHQLVVGRAGEGCGGHGNRHHRGEQVHQLGAHHLRAQHEPEEDEGELAALGQGHGGGERGAVGVPEEAARGIHGECLQDHQARHQRGDRDRVRRDQPQVQACAHGDEEQAEQQPAERLDVGLQLPAEFAFGEHHPGQEGA